MNVHGCKILEKVKGYGLKVEGGSVQPAFSLVVLKKKINKAGWSF
jgi:hypothetical protein